MKCFDPTLCYTDPRGKKWYRSYSMASNLFLQLHQSVFDCGKCLFCRKQKSRELAMRCVLHASLYRDNCFLTLTYDESKEGYHNNFEYSDIQKFKKRLRQYVFRNFGKKIEVFNVHEYGKNGKKHWHLIVFNHDFTEDRVIYSRKNGIPLYTSPKLEDLWPFGFNTVGDVSEASAMYQAQYTQKDFKNGNVTNSKKSHSKHSGIGRPYFLKHFAQILELGYVPFGGKEIPVPRYFEKLAHKHWSHFYEPGNFFDTLDRKKLYTPFKPGLENKLIADLFIKYKANKDVKIQKMSEEWNDVITEHLNTGEPPDFRKAGSNQFYDLKNKITKENF